LCCAHVVSDVASYSGRETFNPGLARRHDLRCVAGLPAWRGTAFVGVGDDEKHHPSRHTLSARYEWRSLTVKRLVCRVFIAAWAASSLLFATRIFADENTGNWFESLSHLPTEYTAEDTYVGDGDVQRGPNKSVRDFDENDSIVHLVFTPRTQLGVLRIGGEWERFSFGLPDHAPLPDTLQSVSLVMGLDMQF